jgi:heme a synthase
MTSLHNLTNRSEQRFQSLAFLTILIIYLLILAGGIVRGTGSGMGCPDWPRCFGQWIPPTDISQLPPNYQEIYGAKLKGEVEFNAVKTWIEYVNRLLGVFSGLFVFATLLASLPFWRTNRPLVWGSVLSFVLIGLNGWLGSRVVATELAHYMITLHLLLAIGVVFALLFVYARSQASFWNRQIAGKTSRMSNLLLLTMLLSLGQILLGTQVREVLDGVIKQLGGEARANWIDALDWQFYVHRSFSIIVLAFHLLIIYQLRGLKSTGILNQVTLSLMIVVMLEIITGAIMGYFAVPAAAQPIHLFLAIIMIGLQFIGWLMLNPKLIESSSTSARAAIVTS